MVAVLYIQLLLLDLYWGQSTFAKADDEQTGATGSLRGHGRSRFPGNVDITVTPLSKAAGSIVKPSNNDCLK